ncbi:hypothetical protein SADUNF_Sadunf10G0165700 [Salix dunnii]|uniref:Uncharacterized protein n=1 Tax=Salix dunnii TaxID=1413687 RepID=A0A835MRB7_9ROSI|nr:hypothetical protein SADUNF_Sadunf10G0165700 [Salix dunnii]
MAHVSDIKLIRTDTTLDLSQKAEKAATHFPIKYHVPKHCFTTRAPTDDNQPDTAQEPGSEYDDQFESRLSQVRLRYRSGTGKKAEHRKTKKGKSSSGSGPGMYLPPVPLKESVSGFWWVKSGIRVYLIQ